MTNDYKILALICDVKLLQKIIKLINETKNIDFMILRYFHDIIGTRIIIIKYLTCYRINPQVTKTNLEDFIPLLYINST